MAQPARSIGSVTVFKTFRVIEDEKKVLVAIVDPFNDAPSPDGRPALFFFCRPNSPNPEESGAIEGRRIAILSLPRLEIAILSPQSLENRDSVSRNP